MSPRTTPSVRPATISELATIAQSDPDASASSNQELKHYLRRAEAHRRTGTALASGAGGGPTASNRTGTADTGTDLERAFIEFARAATLIVEKIPSHRDFSTGLTAEQRSNLTANGQDILHQIGRLKALLVERYERYANSPAASADAVPFFMLPNTAPMQAPVRRASQQVHTQAQRAVADEAAQWRAQREEAAARDRAAYGHAASPAPSAASYASSTTYPSTHSSPAPSPTTYSSASPTSYSASGPPMPMPVPVSLAHAHPSNGNTPQPSALPPTFARAASTVAYPTNPSGTGPRYPSSAGVSFAYPNPHAPVAPQYTGSSSSSSSYAPSASYAPSSSSASSQYSTASTANTPTPGPMPLRAAHTGGYEYDGESTDSDVEGLPPWKRGGGYPAFPQPPNGAQDDLAARMGTLSTGGGRTDGLPPMSNTSPVAYPALARHMSSHQRTQGYVPGAWGSTLPPAAPLVGAGAGAGVAGVGARAALDAARAAAASSSTAAYSTSFAPPPDPQQERERELAATRAAAARTEAERAEPHGRLRTVVLPHATLPRFLAIAAANSAKNLETCGLLLGREVVKGGGTG